MGGPHVNAFSTDVIERSEHVDAVLIGESELVLLNIVLNLDNPGFSWDLPGVTHRATGHIAYAPVTPEFVPNLDELPFMDWEFLGLKNY
jgi:radical SAM superfamily enzyme YgiQ (UPF0313 family)